jgi:type VI secretion system secreted protein VgrG
MNAVVDTLHSLIQDRQHNRVLRLSFPRQDGPRMQLLVNSLNAIESVSRDFEYVVELLSSGGDIPLKDMQGKLLCVDLVQADGSLRHFTGYVFSFRRKESAGSLTVYEARLGPWLKYLSFRKDSCLFHGMTLRQQTEEVFAEYSIYPDWDWQVSDGDPVVTEACQFDETDFNYLSRRWEAAGYHYWYEHTAQGHRLVVSDDSTVAQSIDGDARVLFQRYGGVKEEDSISEWSPMRYFAPASVALSATDFKKPGQMIVAMPTLNNQGDVPFVESYEYAGAYAFKNTTDGDAFAKLRMEEIEAVCKLIDAEGGNRALQPGRAFQLVHYESLYAYAEEAGRNQFLILSVHHTATNNYLHPGAEAPYYRNKLSCTRRDVAWRPGRGFNSMTTRMSGPQTATVVGPNGPDSIYTDAYGRIRVQFHWDRLGQADERSSAWIRVTSAFAGAELGAIAIPRVGSEVVVQWLEGNPDRPIVTGAVVNEENMPPWNLPTQQSLTGLRSRELAPNAGNVAGGRSNHLVLDDTYDHIQAQLKSDHECSQLSLGHISRIEDTKGRKDSRGEGWEIATNAWGVARAGRGMLLTTERRENARSDMKDMGETTDRLAAAFDGHSNLARLAAIHGAQDEKAHQAEVATHLSAVHQSIAGGPDAKPAVPFPELKAPHLVLASQASIVSSSTKSTHFSSNDHTAITAGKDLSLAAGFSFFASVRETFRLFVHRAGMKLIAAAGDIDVRALQNSINLLAKLDVSITANRIMISAKEEIVINGGGSYAKYNTQGIEYGTKGVVVAHAATHTFDKARSVPVPEFDCPTVNSFDEQFRLVDDKDCPLAYTHYTIESTCGKVWKGISDADGFTRRVFTDAPSSLSVDIVSARFDEQFRLVNELDEPLIEQTYRITSACGKTWQGKSDADGLTQRVFTYKLASLSIELLDKV